ncbi:MAG TPA: hypothetical protein VIJ23_05890 [Mycobacterium sp.]
MSDPTDATVLHGGTGSPTTARGQWLRSAARWMVTFLGFPAGGLAAMLIVGPVDSIAAALAGGLVTGAIIGVVQAWGLRLGVDRGRGPAVAWVAATALGLMVGLGIGATAVDFGTSLTDLVIQGAVCGLIVGAAQAFVLRARLRRLALLWPPALAAIWAIGWAVTTAGGIQVEEQFTVFGSFGAITVTAITAVLPVIVHRTSVTPTGKGAS